MYSLKHKREPGNIILELKLVLKKIEIKGRSDTEIKKVSLQSETPFS